MAAPRSKTTVRAAAQPAWRIPRGRGGLSPGVIDEIQRARIVDSLIAVTAERGYGATSIDRLLLHARMAVRTFHTLFESKEDCLLTAYRVLASQVQDELAAAWDAGDQWPKKIRQVVAAALAYAAEDPAAARLLTVEVQAGGLDAQALYADSVDRLAAKLSEGRDRYPEPAALNQANERVVVAGLLTLIGNRLLAGEAELLPGCEAELTEIVLAPYLGRAQAHRIAVS